MAEEERHSNEMTFDELIGIWKELSDEAKGCIVGQYIQILQKFKDLNDNKRKAN